MKAIQPYFVMVTSKYHKKVMMKNGIAHFYKYSKNEQDMEDIMAVPDGCVDLMFERDAHGITGRAAGTVLQRTTILNQEGKEFFGVRFLPGVLPAVLDVSLAELVSKELDLEDILYNKDMLKEIEVAYEKGDWTQVFLKHYNRALCEKEKKEERAVVQMVRHLQRDIINSNGKITVAELAEGCSYSERYVNKVLTQTTGLNPKTFGKIIQFQKAIQMINEEPEEMRLTEIGLESGYYDQAHFVKEFKKYAALTPREYRNLIKQCDYKQRIVVEEN